VGITEFDARRYVHVASCPILPGMTAMAHITHGSQNLLRYLIRSVYMAIEQAFSKT